MASKDINEAKFRNIIHRVDPKAKDDHIRTLFQALSISNENSILNTDLEKIIEFLEFACVYYFSSSDSYNKLWIEFWHEKKKSNIQHPSDRKIYSSHGTLEKFYSRLNDNSSREQNDNLESQQFQIYTTARGASGDIIKHRNILGYLDRISSTNDTVLDLLDPSYNDRIISRTQPVKSQLKTRTSRIEKYANYNEIPTKVKSVRA